MIKEDDVKYGEISKQKERYLYIDILKCIAIFFVVALHTGLWNINFISGNEVSTTKLIQYSIRVIYECVPIFMFINGFLIIRKHINLSSSLKKTLKILIIFLIWGIVLTVLIKTSNHEKIDLREIVQIVLKTKCGSNYTGVLWFLQKLILIYLFFPVIKVLYDKDYKIYKYLLIILSISTFGFEILRLILDFNFFHSKETLNIILSFLDQFYVKITDNIYLIYFMLGGYVYKNQDEFKNNKYIIFGIISASIIPIYGIVRSLIDSNVYASNYNYGMVTLAITVIGLYSLTNKINIKNNILSRFISSVGKNTMGIYLIHIFFINAIGKFINVGDLNFIFRFLIVILIIIVSWLVTIIIKKIPKVSYIVKI